MRTRLVAAALIIGSLLLTLRFQIVPVWASNEPAAQQPDPPTRISAREYSFEPAYPTVAAGATITWVNRDPEAHTITSDVGLFDVEIGPGERFSFTFDEPGAYFYFCKPHDWMIGEVTVEPTVEAAAAPSDGGAPVNHGVDIVMLGYEFQPTSITLRAGDVVTWTNFDAEPHTATFDPEGWTTSALGGGESGSIAFLEPGTYTYLCEIHPSMQGEIVVLVTV